MSYYSEDPEEREDREAAEREPRTYPDMYIEPDALCCVCKVQNSLERLMLWSCSVCNGATHTECGEDCEPSGGWDRDYEVNYWVCNNCRKASAEETAAELVPIGSGQGSDNLPSLDGHP